ncbi:MAG: hypothetical protein N2645_22475 [Clostridia bacterium]|nr:hypothetical protein [Clostridia bacterium]
MYFVVADLEKGTIESTGDRNSVHCDKLIENLFGDIDFASKLYASMDGQVKPQSWKQGNSKCVICIPRTSIIVGLFYIEHRDTIESYNWAKKINNELIEMWKF